MFGYTLRISPACVADYLSQPTTKPSFACYTRSPSQLIFLQLSITAWLVAKYNAHHSFTHRSLRTRVQCTLFTSIWTVLFETIFLIMFMVGPIGLILTSIVAHDILLVVRCRRLTVTAELIEFSSSVVMTWVRWVAAAAAITQSVGGNLICKCVSALYHFSLYIHSPSAQDARFCGVSAPQPL